MTPDDLTRLRALCEQATAAPWCHYEDHGEIGVHGKPAGVIARAAPSDFRTHEQDHVDFALIAAAREAVPQLLAEVERLRAEAERYAWATAASTMQRPKGCRCDLWTRGYCREGCPSGNDAVISCLRALLAEACEIADALGGGHGDIAAHRRIAEIRREGGV